MLGLGCLPKALGDTDVVRGLGDVWGPGDLASLPEHADKEKGVERGTCCHFPWGTTHWPSWSDPSLTSRPSSTQRPLLQPVSICTYHQASQSPFLPSLQSFLSIESIYSTIEPVEIWPLDLCLSDKILRERVLMLAGRRAICPPGSGLMVSASPFQPGPCLCAFQHAPKHSCGKQRNLREREELVFLF